MSSLPQLLLESVLISVLVSIILWAIRRVAHAAAEDAQRAPRAPMKLHFSKEWLRRRLETDPEEPGVMACDPQFLTPPSHQHFTFAGIADPSLEEAEALAQDVVDATDDLTVQAAHLRRVSELRTALIREQAQQIARLRAENAALKAANPEPISD